MRELTRANGRGSELVSSRAREQELEIYSYRAGGIYLDLELEL